jgi:hypothetical protein
VLHLCYYFYDTYVPLTKDNAPLKISAGECLPARAHANKHKRVNKTCFILMYCNHNYNKESVQPRFHGPIYLFCICITRLNLSSFFLLSLYREGNGSHNREHALSAVQVSPISIIFVIFLYNLELSVQEACSFRYLAFSRSGSKEHL